MNSHQKREADLEHTKLIRLRVTLGRDSEFYELYKKLTELKTLLEKKRRESKNPNEIPSTIYQKITNFTPINNKRKTYIKTLKDQIYQLEQIIEKLQQLKPIYDEELGGKPTDSFSKYYYFINDNKTVPKMDNVKNGGRNAEGVRGNSFELRSTEFTHNSLPNSNGGSTQKKINHQRKATRHIYHRKNKTTGGKRKSRRNQTHKKSKKNVKKSVSRR